MTTTIILVLVTLLFSAFFSGMEIGFVASNRLLAEMERSERNGISQRILKRFYRHPNTFVSTMLVGNNIALVIYGIAIAQLFDQTIFRTLPTAVTVPLDTIISTIIVLFTGEFLPKTLFKSAPNTLLTFFAVPAWICYVLLYPISRFCTMLSRLCLRLFGVKVERKHGDEVFTRVDLDHLVQTSIDRATDEEEIEDEVRIFQNALDFADTKVRDCLIPRTEINAVELSTSEEELMQLFIESGHSKIIVYKEDIDHIVGYIHSHEMYLHHSEWQKQIRTMPFVPETMPAQKLMQRLLQQKRSLAVVIDEFGGTSGIVSLEDIVEDIFGEIEDEHDSNNYVAKCISPGEYILSGRLEIEKINEQFDLNLPESSDYQTLAGLVLAEYQSFPKLNEVIQVAGYALRVVKSSQTKIELIRLSVLPQSKEK